MNPWLEPAHRRRPAARPAGGTDGGLLTLETKASSRCLCKAIETIHTYQTYRNLNLHRFARPDGDL
jgi:hypothetical protein